MVAAAIMLYPVYNIIIFLPKVGTLPYLVVFLNSTLAVVVSEISRGPKFTLGALCPLDAN